jgi:transposase
LGFGIVAVGRRKEDLFMAKDIVKEIRRATRRKFNAEEKIRIVLEGLRGEVPVSDLCRRESIAPTLYYRWPKAFLDSGKNGLTRDTQRARRRMR